MPRSCPSPPPPGEIKARRWTGCGQGTWNAFRQHHQHRLTVRCREFPTSSFLFKPLILLIDYCCYTFWQQSVFHLKLGEQIFHHRLVIICPLLTLSHRVMTGSGAEYVIIMFISTTSELDLQLFLTDHVRCEGSTTSFLFHLYAA